MNNIPLLKDAIFVAIACLALAVSNIKILKIMPVIVVAAILFFEIVVLFDMQQQSAEIYPLIFKGIILTLIFASLISVLAFRKKDRHSFIMSCFLFLLRWSLFFAGMHLFYRFGLSGNSLEIWVLQLAIFSVILGTFICTLTFERQAKHSAVKVWFHYFKYLIWTAPFLFFIYYILIFSWAMRLSH